MLAAGDVATAAAWNVLVNNDIALAVSPAVKCTRSTRTAYTAGNALAWPGTDAYDTDNMHNPATNNSRITINTAGIYLLTTSFFLDYAGTLTNAYPFFYKNGTTIISKMERGAFNSTTNFRFTYTAIEKFSVADYVEVKVDIGSSRQALCKVLKKYFICASSRHAPMALCLVV